MNYFSIVELRKTNVLLGQNDFIFFSRFGIYIYEGIVYRLLHVFDHLSQSADNENLEESSIITINFSGIHYPNTLLGN